MRSSAKMSQRVSVVPVEGTFKEPVGISEAVGWFCPSGLLGSFQSSSLCPICLVTFLQPQVSAWGLDLWTMEPLHPSFKSRGFHLVPLDLHREAGPDLILTCSCRCWLTVVLVLCSSLEI